MSGCPQCYPRRQQTLAGGQTAEALWGRTRQRAWELEQRHGYTLWTVWECEFQRWLRRKPAAVRRLYTDVCRAVPGPMDLRRDALFGGRVEPFALHYACGAQEEIAALDIVSDAGGGQPLISSLIPPPSLGVTVPICDEVPRLSGVHATHTDAGAVER